MHRAFQLTEREREVTRMLKAGLGPQEIARQMGIKPATVYQYIWLIKDKYETDHLVGLMVKLLQE